MRYCKTKIYAQPIPSSEDVAQIKAEKIMDRIASVIEETDLRDMINFIEKQINESDFTAMDIAAAFLKQEIGGASTAPMAYGGSSYQFGDTGAESGMVRLFINIGKKQKVKPGDILGAVAGESGISGDVVGTIDMYDKFTFVEVPVEYGNKVLAAMKNVKIKGKDINIEPANSR